MGVFSCKVELYIWIRKSGELWEYVAVYVEDLVFVVQYPTQFIKELEDTYKYKFKCAGSISFHFGCNFFRDDDINLCMVKGSAPRR